HPAYVAAQAVTTSRCFVKGVTEPITQQALTTQLAIFGTIKELDIVRSKACAFVEFTGVDAAKRAIIASLPAALGGGGGVWVEAAGEVSTARITVETMKERGDRPVSRPRGGAPQSETRGGGGGPFRGARGRGGRVALGIELGAVDLPPRTKFRTKNDKINKRNKGAKFIFLCARLLSCLSTIGSFYSRCFALIFSHLSSLCFYTYSHLPAH
ncbi:hypothetical protein F5146DRAFT_927184, partial [Armillaria mellea]